MTFHNYIAPTFGVFESLSFFLTDQNSSSFYLAILPEEQPGCQRGPSQFVFLMRQTLIYFDGRKIGILSYQFSPRNIPLFVTRARRLVSHRIFGAFPPFRSTQGARTRHLRCTLAQLDASTALNQFCTKATCKLTTFIVVKRTLKSLGFFSEIKAWKKYPKTFFLWVRL